MDRYHRRGPGVGERADDGNLLAHDHALDVELARVRHSRLDGGDTLATFLVRLEVRGSAKGGRDAECAGDALAHASELRDTRRM